MFVSAAWRLVIAGLHQMTIAQKEHVMKEDGTVHFADMLPIGWQTNGVLI
jgi:hypothetical protein